MELRTDKPHSLRLLIIIFVMLVPQVYARSQRLELKDLTDLVGTSELVAVSGVSISPNGDWVAYTTSTTSLTTGIIRRQLWVQPFEGGEPIRIGREQEDNDDPVWSPDSRKLLFSTTSSGHSALAIWSVAERTTRAIEIAVSTAAKWFPDGVHFLVGVAPEKSERPKTIVDPKKPAPIVLTADENVHWLTESHYISSIPTGNDAVDLVIVNAGSGTLKTVATKLCPFFLDFQLSPDATKFFYTVFKGYFDDDANSRVVFDIRVVDLRNGSNVLEAKDVLRHIASPVWSHNSRMLAYIGGTFEDDNRKSPAGSSIFRSGQCYIVDLEHPSLPRRIGTKIFNRDLSPIWSDDDTAIYAISQRQAGVPATMFKLPLTAAAVETIGTLPVARDLSITSEASRSTEVYVSGFNGDGEKWALFAFNLRSHQFTPITQGERTIVFPSASVAGSRLAYLAENSFCPPNVWVSELTANDSHPLTHFGPDLAKSEKVGETISVSWIVNGETRYGTVWLPAGYRKEKRYPTIVDVYPTDQGVSVRNAYRGNPFFESLIWQEFSANGYAVFWPDFHLPIGATTHDVVEQILPALDKIVDAGIADPNGMGVYGRSWGGYSTYSLIAETGRFKAALSASGYANLLTPYGELEPNGDTYVLGIMENDQEGASPWENADLYRDSSPYFHFDRVTTPVMIEYGEQDSTFAFASKEAFVALRRLGKTATLLGYPDDGHGLGKLENKIDFTSRALGWFDRYLKAGQQENTAIAPAR